MYSPTVAFTHGYSDDEFEMGLVPSAFLGEVALAANKLAAKHGQKVTLEKIGLASQEEVEKGISKVLDDSESAWLAYTYGEKGHIIGVLNKGEKKYMLWNAASSQRISETTVEVIAETVTKNQPESNPRAFIFGFSKSDSPGRS